MQKLLKVPYIHLVLYYDKYPGIHSAYVSSVRNFPFRALPLQEKSVRNVSSVCPVCNVVFPPGAFDLFRQHFDGHLS